jgi:hypothetical protein
MLILVVCVTSQAFAAGGKKPWSTTLSFAYTTQDFKGDETSDFKKVQHYLIDYRFQWHRKWYTLGFAYATTPSINISSFVLSTGETGSYKLSFNQLFLIIGATYKKMFFNIVLGSETTRWVGTPAMQLKNSGHSINGIELGYDAHHLKKFVVPVWFRYLTKPKRNLEFQNYTNDSIIVDPGVELVLAGGIRYDF